MCGGHGKYLLLAVLFGGLSLVAAIAHNVLESQGAEAALVQGAYLCYLAFLITGATCGCIYGAKQVGPH